MLLGRDSEWCLILLCNELALTLLLFIGASRAAAVTRFQTMVLSVQVTVQTTVDIQVGVTAEQTRLIWEDSASISLFFPPMAKNLNLIQCVSNFF